MSIKKTKKSSKSERKKLIKKLDKIFSEYIRLRDGYKCVLCGSRTNVQAGHLITRNKYSTRWNEENVFAQCKSCNYRHEYQPEIYTSWYIEKFGEKKYLDLVKRSNVIVKYKNYDLETMIEHYKQKIEKLKQKENGGK